jgi:L-threonylcarbamoyladenylate synthase
MILPSTAETLRKASELVLDGGVIAFRTDTFYGLGADPLNAAAVRRVRELKGREDGKPILLLVSDAAAVDRFITSKSEIFRKLAKKLWPGPLTLVGSADKALPDDLTAGTKTVGVRFPADDRVTKLVGACGGALTATSANPSGNLPALTAEEVEAYFPGLIEVIIDDGEVMATEPSTVVDTTGTAMRVVREGAITNQQLQRALK